MRTTAIIMVVCSHILWIYPKSNAFIPILFELFGFWGVELFFVLSGFLIGGILLKQLDKYKFNLNFLFDFWIRSIPHSLKRKNGFEKKLRQNPFV